ncbi:MAG: hypothetical protein ABSE21_18115 [Bryobacteraceae bacterium]
MKGKYWAVAILLLLVIGRPARAVEGSFPTSTAGGFPKLAAGSFQTLAAGAGTQLEMRQARIPARDATKYFVPVPSGVWRPLLIFGTEWREHYAGVFVKTSSGRLSLMITTLASRQATLLELRLSVRQLLDGLHRIGLIVSHGVESAGNED